MIVEKINPNAIIPTKNPQDSWYDFYTPKDMETIILQPWENKVIPLGIKIELPNVTDWNNIDLTFTNRSSVASKRCLVVGACLVDNWYRWELMVDLHNIGNKSEAIIWWEKIVQWVIRKSYHFPVYEDNVDNNTERWEGWFWSTWS